MKILTTTPEEMASILAGLPKEDQAHIDLANCPSMQATNHSAFDSANFYNRGINQEFNH